MSEEKFCGYYKTTVVVSRYNRQGKCPCLNCDKDTCDDECHASLHPVLISAKCLSGRICWRHDRCKDCLDFSEQYSAPISIITRKQR